MTLSQSCWASVLVTPLGIAGGALGPLLAGGGTPVWSGLKSGTLETQTRRDWGTGTDRDTKRDTVTEPVTRREKQREWTSE